MAKTAAKKTDKNKNETEIKYADKSAGQQELLSVFETLKEMIAPYEKGTMKSKSAGGQYHLCSHKQIEVVGRKMDEVYFASLMVQKGYVGFYFMPVYAKPELKKDIKPALLKCLKGKSCFHIKKLDDELKAQIKDALAIGYTCYQNLGWV